MTKNTTTAAGHGLTKILVKVYPHLSKAKLQTNNTKIKPMSRNIFPISDLIGSCWIQATGLLFKTHRMFPQILLFQAGLWEKSLPCLQLQPGLKPFLFTSMQWWCHCYIYRGLLCSVFQPGLWVIGMACLLIQTCFWKKFGMSPNTTWLVLKRKEYLLKFVLFLKAF